MNWNRRCAESIRRARKEVEQRYGIGIGQTEIYCASCSRPWGFGKHLCQEIRLQRLNDAKKKAAKETQDLCQKLQRLGARKASIMLYKENEGIVTRDIGEETVRGWIKRGNVPEKYQQAVSQL